MRTVIIGYGMAGARVAGDLLARDRTLDVTVLGGEPHPAYNRILLSSVLAGKADETATLLPPPRGERFRLHLGVSAVHLDRDARLVTASDGSTHPYDALVLATGSQPLIPKLDGLVDPLVFRTLDDCRRITEAAADARSALVLGGGLLGLEAARGLAARGLTVTVAHRLGHLMERQLDPFAGGVLTRTLADLGINVLLDAEPVAVTDNGPGLRFADGAEARADLLVLSCGVLADTALAQSAGLSVGRGILVDDELRTSDPDIFAIGDCAEFPGSITGLVAPAWAQAGVVADLLTGADPTARFRPVPVVTRLKAAGIDLAAMGDSAGVGWADDAVIYADPPRGRYAKLIIRNDRLVGAIMLGDNPGIGAVIQHFDRQTPLPGDPRPLLLGRPGAGTPGDEESAPVSTSPALMPDAAIVCRCNAVSKGAIKRAWLTGERDLTAATRAGTGCGGCLDVVTGIASWLSAVDGTAAALGDSTVDSNDLTTPEVVRG